MAEFKHTATDPSDPALRPVNLLKDFSTSEFQIDSAAALNNGGNAQIPITGHPFTVGDVITITGTTNYNISNKVISTLTNSVTLVTSYVAETFTSTAKATYADKLTYMDDCLAADWTAGVFFKSSNAEFNQVI